MAFAVPSTWFSLSLLLVYACDCLPRNREPSRSILAARSSSRSPEKWSSASAPAILYPSRYTGNSSFSSVAVAAPAPANTTTTASTAAFASVSDALDRRRALAAGTSDDHDLSLQSSHDAVQREWPQHRRGTCGGFRALDTGLLRSGRGRSPHQRRFVSAIDWPQDEDMDSEEEVASTARDEGSTTTSFFFGT